MWTSLFFIDFLPCVTCQLPNIYDLTWFESFSLENYEGLFNSHDQKIKEASSPLEEKITLSNKEFEKFAKTTEDSNESADVSLEEGGHFDSRFVQQSDR